MYVRKCIKAHQSKPLFNDVNKCWSLHTLMKYYALMEIVK